MTQQLALLGGSPVRTRPFPAWPEFGPPEERRLLDTLHSGKWGKQDGTQTGEFERAFSAYHGTEHGIAVVNGTISLQIALMAAGIQAGDEVIVPPYTFLATATAVVAVNATPVFVDIELDTLNISPAAIERAITPRTRAIIPVHFGGLPVDMDAIMAIARRHNLFVIEDAAHAHGAEYKGRRVGSLGHIGSFSFQSSKNLSSGEGGILVTNDAELAGKCRSIHNCGRLPGHAWYEHFVMSANFRIGEFQSAILNAQLARLDEQIARREANAKYLIEHLHRIPGIKPQGYSPDCTRHAFHLLCFRFDEKAFGAPRKRALEAIAAEGIPIFGGYPQPLYRQPLFVDRAFGSYDGCRADYAKVSCPNCETICNQQGGWMEQRMLLGPREDMDDIVRAFNKVHAAREQLGAKVAAS